MFGNYPSISTLHMVFLNFPLPSPSSPLSLASSPPLPQQVLALIIFPLILVFHFLLHCPKLIFLKQPSRRIPISQTPLLVPSSEFCEAVCLSLLCLIGFLLQNLALLACLLLSFGLNLRFLALLMLLFTCLHVNLFKN